MAARFISRVRVCVCACVRVSERLAARDSRRFRETIFIVDLKI